MMKKFALILPFIILRLSTFSQNLIPNPGFEEFNGKQIVHWESTAWSPDFYKPSDNSMLEYIRKCTEDNNSFAGIMFMGEVTSLKLNTPLEKDQYYSIRILAQRPYAGCPSGIKKVTVAFTNNKLPRKEGEKPSYYSIPFINLLTDDLKSTKERCKWVEFSAIYKANGTENYFHLGDFRKNTTSKDSIVKGIKLGDDIIITDTMKNNDCTYVLYDNVVVEKLDIKKGIIIPGIFFETNKSKILPESYGALDKLANQLIAGKFKIKIIGHTDNIGDKNKNLLLSKERAKAIVNYLVKKGVGKSQLYTEGMGDTKPIADNNTELGRAKNRRVEIKIIE